MFDIKKKLIFSGIIAIAIFSFPKASNAFIPYLYYPNKKTLKKTGTNFAKTAAQLIHFGQTKQAIQVAELSVTLNPKDYRLWSVLAEAQLKENLLKEANLSLEKAKELNPDNAQIWFIQGSIALQQKQSKEAIYLIQKGLALEPNSHSALFQLGNARLIQFNHKLALKAFEKATEIKPNFWEALNNQGLVLFEIGKKKKAIKTWRKVLTITENAEPMLALAAALNKTTNYKEEAIKLAIDALAKNPNYVLSSYQEDQLWGYEIQKATKALFQSPELIDAVERAIANSE